MFIYFHGYRPEIWKGYEKVGWVNENAGVRFIQHIALPSAMKFNSLAAKGSVLYGMIKSERLPFYIDRAQGGTFIDANYEFDKNLLREYDEMLGKNFLGFQLHEWASNLYSDIARILECSPEKWTAREIERAVRKKHVYEFLNLESNTAEEFEKYGKIDGSQRFFEVADAMYRNRAARYGKVLPCDSIFLACKYELDHGAENLMLEIGAQTPDTRIQIAYATGMSKSRGTRFGVYYEPWGGEPFSTCCYQTEKINEWGMGNGEMPFSENGVNGGSSRSLQKRIQLYAYFAGAEFISEEWGVCNAFYDWHDFGLSPYGRIKSEILRIIEKYQDRGNRIAPIAAVLPDDMFLLTEYYYDYSGSPLSEYERDPKVRCIKAELYKIFAKAYAMAGDPMEIKALKNSPVPDAIDIVHESEVHALGKYEYLIDLTEYKRLKNKYKNVCDADRTEELLKNLLPCTVEGEAHWFVNKKTNGGYYFIAFNHSGIFRNGTDGERAIKSEEKQLFLRLKSADARLKRKEGGTCIPYKDGYKITIPSGEWFLGEF